MENGSTSSGPSVEKVWPMMLASGAGCVNSKAVRSPVLSPEPLMKFIGSSINPTQLQLRYWWPWSHWQRCG